MPVKERTLLQRASVIGRHFWETALAELAVDEADRFKKDELALLLDAVSRRELVFRQEPSTFASSQEYTFKHAILREVIYETVLLKQRRVYHRQVAEWMETTASERLEEYLGLIAGQVSKRKKRYYIDL